MNTISPLYNFTYARLQKGGVFMENYGGERHHGSASALIVVLFILLIIVGATFIQY